MKQQAPAAPAAAATDGLVQLQVFLQCFEVTFFYKQYLMALRSGAFTHDKKCELGGEWCSLHVCMFSFCVATLHLPSEALPTWLVQPVMRLT